jgi:hypothetical protein
VRDRARTRPKTTTACRRSPGIAERLSTAAMSGRLGAEHLGLGGFRAKSNNSWSRAPNTPRNRG